MEQKAANQFNNLKTGEYCLHVYVENTNALLNPGGADLALDPLMTIKAFEQEQQSTVKYGRGNDVLYWGEHFFFNQKIKDRKELERLKLEFFVKNYSMLGSDSDIGYYQMDFLKTYFEPNQAILHRWVGIYKNIDNKVVVTGFLQFSLNLVHEGDEQIILEHSQDQFDASKVIMPSLMEQKSYQMTIRLYRAQNVVDMDYFGSVDPVLKFEIGNINFYSEVTQNKFLYSYIQHVVHQSSTQIR